MSATGPTLQDLLTDAAERALRAPSVFNTQPWRWQVGDDHLALYADRARRLSVVDPDARLLTVSCGTALHHARVALTAAGHRTSVRVLPDPARPSLLAEIRLDGAHEPSPEEFSVAEAISTRHTNRRAFADTPVPEPLVQRLCAVAAAQQAHLHVIRDGQLPMLSIAVAQAGALELADPAYRSELIRWTNRPDWCADGVPPETTVRSTPRRVPVRSFSADPGQGMAPGAGHDRGAIFTVLFGDTDDPAGWLTAGQALSAVLLTAAAEGLAAAPISDVIEVPSTRELLRGMLSGLGYPMVALRIGIAVPAATDPAATPRRAATDVIAPAAQPAAAAPVTGGETAP